MYDFINLIQDWKGVIHIGVHEFLHWFFAPWLSECPSYAMLTDSIPIKSVNLLL
jgi:hypothetical protein